KVAQMIIPALRTWGSGDDAVSATTLSDEQKAALMKYSFGGVIIFGQNIEEAGQTTQLISSMLWALISICDEYYGDRCRLEEICRKYDVPITIQDYQSK
ncbi:hypothetical protein, partial [Butyrivibrio fibrisolvens]|uniref:hypothetical protein n=1 Tax=Butyrivibrio fibrisolvens TaxID=831 RepID=UPI0005506ECF